MFRLTLESITEFTLVVIRLQIKPKTFEVLTETPLRAKFC